MILIRNSIISIIVILLLTGCLYPDEERTENQIPYQDQLDSVQSAVLQYRMDNGALPVKTREEGTPLFRKYPVNFAQLVPRYMQTAPGNSFESGGVFQYVVVNPEEMAEVKLIDLTIIRQIQDFERRIQSYQRDSGYAPVAEVVSDELLLLDYEALNYEEQPTVKSPFHPNHRLPLLMQANGEIIIDYSLDIQYYYENEDISLYEEGDDLRWLLVENSPFVPAYSRPQTFKDGEVIFMKQDK